MKNPHLYLQKKSLARVNDSSTRDVSFKPVEKRVAGPIMTNKKHESRMKLEEEILELRRPHVSTYSPDDRKVKTQLPLYTIPKARRGDRTPSPDKQKPLFVSTKLTKKDARKVAILP